MKHDIRICILLLVATFAAAASWAAPRLIVPPEGVAFGEIAAGEAAAKSIELRNVSSSPVAVSQVKGCCGADAALSAMRVEPGSAATLSVSLKPMLPGEFSKHVQILCDDPESPVINIPVTGAAVESKSASAASRCSRSTTSRSSRLSSSCSSLPLRRRTPSRWRNGPPEM